MCHFKVISLVLTRDKVIWRLNFIRISNYEYGRQQAELIMITLKIYELQRTLLKDSCV